MAYTPTFVSADLSAIVIDFIGTLGVEFVAFAALVALTVLAIWFRGRGRKLMK